MVKRGGVRAPFMRSSSFASPIRARGGRQVCVDTTLMAGSGRRRTIDHLTRAMILPFAWQTNWPRQPGSVLSM